MKSVVAIYALWALIGKLSADLLNFYEEPNDSFVTKDQSAVLKCKIENAKSGFFKCNDHWSPDSTSSRLIQIGNKQLLTLEMTISQNQLDEYRKFSIYSDSESLPSFWCVCLGWLNNESITSKKIFVKSAYLDEIFDWEPMATVGLIGRSAEIRCLPPDGEPKPNIYWLKNGVAIDKSNKRIYVSHEGSLLISEVLSSDSANYSCVAENMAAKRISEPALLSVAEDKGWTEWSNWTECVADSNCGEGVQKRFRTCQNPPTINNAIGCDGFPYQTIVCYIPCPEPELQLTNDKILLGHYSAQDSATDEIGYFWTEWSAWSMICNADCLRSRTRECQLGHKLNGGKIIPINEDINIKSDKCFGPNIEYSNCTFYCEKISNLIPSSTKPKEFPYSAILFLILSISIVILVVIIISFLTLRKKKTSPENCKSSDIDNHPIYFSIQPEYNQDHYMESLLPLNFKNQLNSNIFAYDMNKHYNTSTYLATNYDETASGSNSTASSKVKLSSSPTDSLAKNSLYLLNENSLHSNSLCSAKKNPRLDLDDKSSQILKIISDHKSVIYTAENMKFDDGCSNEFDVYSFNIFNCGGLIEIIKYGINILVPDETFENEIQAGILKNGQESVLSLRDDETLLSSIFVIKTNYESEVFAKPVVFSMDHSALFCQTDWEFSIYHKGYGQSFFERIDEAMNTNFYFQLTPNRCFMITEYEGMFALVGRPKNNGNVCPSVKQMKYAILLVDGEIRVYFIQNTKAAGEILNEYIQIINGKIVKMPEIFELNYPKKDRLENSYLNLELNVTYNNLLINSDSTCRKIRLSEIWNSSCDFIEIQIPFSLNDQTCKQLKNSINFKLLNENYKQISRTNFDLKVSLELEDKLLFSYANLNTTLNYLHTANCNQQEFYSSVSVNPVFIPLKVSMLLDEFFHQCLKINTLKRKDWKLLASLLKCNRDDQFFTLRENSFELIVSLLLMINLVNSECENSLTVNILRRN